MTRKILLFPLALGLTAASASAAITYVDAERGPSGNTYATGGSLGDTSWVVDSDSSAENATQWYRRAAAGRGVGDTVFHARDNGEDTIPELTVELAGLADGTYNLYAFFWDDPASVNNTQNIDAGLTSGSLVTVAADNPLSNGEAAIVAPLASTFSYNGFDPTTASLFGSWNLHAAPLGQAVVTGGSSIKIYIDHSQPVAGLSSTAQVRSLFDGVGYELVPEPSVSLLGALGALMLLRRRRS